MRRRVCLLYMLLVLASAVFLGSESLGTSDHILLSQIWCFHFRRLLRLAGHGGGIRPRIHRGALTALFRFSRYSLCEDSQRTPLVIVPILLHDVVIGADRIENTGSRVVSVLFPSNSCFRWLHNFGLQQSCNNTYLRIPAMSMFIYVGPTWGRQLQT
jgi:hypothetical protein